MIPRAGAAVVRIADGEHADARTGRHQVQPFGTGQRRHHGAQVLRLLRQSRAPRLAAIRHLPTGGRVGDARRRPVQPRRLQSQLQNAPVAVSGIEDLQGEGVDDDRQGDIRIGLNRVTQPHGPVGREVEDQTLRKGRQTFIALDRRLGSGRLSLKTPGSPSNR